MTADCDAALVSGDSASCHVRLLRVDERIAFAYGAEEAGETRVEGPAWVRTRRGGKSDEAGAREVTASPYEGLEEAPFPFKMRGAA